MASTTFEVDVDNDTFSNVTVKVDDDTLPNSTVDVDYENVKVMADDDALATGVNARHYRGKKLLSAVYDDKDDLVRQISNLAPAAQKSLSTLLKTIVDGKAEVVTDADGKTNLKYKPAKNPLCGVSGAHSIALAKSKVDVQLQVDSVLELFQCIGEGNPPSGVLLDSTKISLSKKKDYQLGQEFTITEKVLGRGNSADDIVVLKDIKTGEKHANKTMMLSCCRSNEIRCWVDLNDTGYVPRLYLFKIDGNKVSFHMEILKEAKTLRSIIDDQWQTFQHSRSLLRTWSLFVLYEALEVLSVMHRKGWVHKAIHLENVMIQKKSEKMLAFKILHFGNASRINREVGGLDLKGFKSDISEVLRMFSALYCGNEFNDAYDIQTNWKKTISDIKMEVDEKEELMCLVKAGMELVKPDEVNKYRNLVEVKLNNAMGDQQEEIMQKFVSLLFPENFPNGPTDMDNADKCHDVVDCTGPQQVSRYLPPNKANTTGNKDTGASAKLMKQIRKLPNTSTVRSE